MSNNAKPAPDPLSTELSTADRSAIARLSEIARDLTGVQLAERHQSMVSSRLRKRITELGLGSLSDYLAYFEAHRTDEAPRLIGLLTTHHTYFFREFSHFEYLQNHALPELVRIAQGRPDKRVKIWVAACSRGQEAYSLAMFLNLHLPRLDPSVTYEILGTDIDPESVEIAKNGVYLRNELKEVPLSLLGDNWARGSGEIEAYVKAKRCLRDKLRFRTENLLTLSERRSGAENFDLIFCRNVFIYFNPDQIKSISQELLARLQPKGYFFIGISESLSGLKLPVNSTASSVYRHVAATIAPAAPTPLRVVPPAAALAPRKLRVLCVDDSPAILTLLKQILSAQDGFEVVGVAKNGLEAAEQIKVLKPDLLTLDIHMPEQTGIEYLEKNMRPGHPPVVMVTSVSRDNSELAGRALALGAADFVEKPALSNLKERGEELRNKLRCSAMLTQAPSTTIHKLDRSFQKTTGLTQLDQKLRIISLPLSARARLTHLLRELSGSQPPTVIWIEGAGEAIAALAETLSKETGFKITHPRTLPATPSPGEILLLDLATSANEVKERWAKGRDVSILVFGEVSPAGAEQLLSFRGAHLVLEDLGRGEGTPALMGAANDVVASTSFAYLSLEHFGRQRKAA